MSKALEIGELGQYITTDTSGGSIALSADLILDDSKYLIAGNGEDLQIGHDGTNSIIDNITGNFLIRNNSPLGGFGIYQDDNLSVSKIVLYAGGGTATPYVNLYHNAVKKFETTAAGVTITGTATATAFSGSGASLTALNASQITTGTIPSADRFGSSLTPQFASLGVGTAASGTTGEIRATNNITAYYSSDISLKENIKNINNPIDKLMSINGVEFDWTDDYLTKSGGEDGYFVRKHDVGVIAQEIEKVLPEVVAEREDGTKAVKYDRIVALLIEAVKDLSKQVEELKSK